MLYEDFKYVEQILLGVLLGGRLLVTDAAKEEMVKEAERRGSNFISFKMEPFDNDRFKMQDFLDFFNELQDKVYEKRWAWKFWCTISDNDIWFQITPLMSLKLRNFKFSFLNQEELEKLNDRRING